MNDLTTREVFDRLVQTQDKLIEVQKDTAKALQNMSNAILKVEETLETLKTRDPCAFNKYSKWLVGIAVGGWILAALALGVKGLPTILKLFGVG